MSMKTLLNVLTIFSLGTLTGCDYIEKSESDRWSCQTARVAKSKIEELEKQQEQYKNKAELFEKQQNNITNSTRILASIVKTVKEKQDEFVFTEFNPLQTQYFILNNGSVGLAGRVLAIDAVENGSVIRISLVNLLSVPVSNIGFHATWGMRTHRCQSSGEMATITIQHHPEFHSAINAWSMARH